MAKALPKQITLGELIAAVTDEVARQTRGSDNTNVMVSIILRELFAKRRVRLKGRRVLIFA